MESGEHAPQLATPLATRPCLRQHIAARRFSLRAVIQQRAAAVSELSGTTYLYGHVRARLPLQAETVLVPLIIAESIHRLEESSCHQVEIISQLLRHPFDRLYDILHQREQPNSDLRGQLRSLLSFGGRFQLQSRQGKASSEGEAEKDTDDLSIAVRSLTSSKCSSSLFLKLGPNLKGLSARWPTKTRVRTSASASERIASALT